MASTRRRRGQEKRSVSGARKQAGVPVEDREGRAAQRSRVERGRARQREEYGGFNLGAAFFGWLVATGLAVLLIAILGAAGAAIGLTELSESEAEGSAGTISIVGGVLLIAVLAVAYYAGGYVAGRLSRFDGARQGLGAWLFGLAVTVLLAAAGAVLGSEYNVLERLDLPRIPVDEGSLTTGGLIALGVVLLATLVAAIVGGKVGERYHKKVDRAGI
ncbi:MAG: hypothetical protein H0U84_07950 [Thermoleophilaceae bacterium]|nr:hypothetical protein [Thermoleophilaceae bacterium]